MTKHTFVWSGIEDEAFETFNAGRKWQANVPQEVDSSEGFTEDNRRVCYVDMLRRNPCFSEIGGEVKVHKRRGRPPKFPNAAEEHGYTGGGAMISAIPGEPLGS